MKELCISIFYISLPRAGKTTILRWIKDKLPQRASNPPFPIQEEVNFIAPGLTLSNGFRVRVCLKPLALSELTNADALILLIDSSQALEENQLFISQVQERLQQITFVGSIALQYNKRDLSQHISAETLDKALLHSGWLPFESIATTGEGVIEPIRELTRSIVTSREK